MSGGEDDPEFWIKYVGEPMRKDVDGLKRAFWWAAGGCGGAGVVLGMLMPYVMKKLGLN